MNIRYYNLSVNFLLVSICLCLLGAWILTIIRCELYDYNYYRLSKLSMLIGSLFIFSAIILFCASNIYGEKYRKQCYKQCEIYMNEKYNVHIVDYTEMYKKNGSVYTPGGDVYIKTYFYNARKLCYVEYEAKLLENGIIQYQNTQIYSSD